MNEISSFKRANQLYTAITILILLGVSHAENTLWARQCQSICHVFHHIVKMTLDHIVAMTLDTIVAYNTMVAWVPG